MDEGPEKKRCYEDGNMKYLGDISMEVLQGEMAEKVHFGAGQAASGSEIQVLCKEENGSQGKESLWSNLNTDVLLKVLSFLPQKDLFEVMSISKHWEEAVMGGEALWREVKVHRKWYKTKAIERLMRLLGSAEGVTFSSVFRRDTYLMQSVGGAFGPNLRTLNIPDACISPIYLSHLLTNCCQLRALVVGGEPADDSPIVISHQNLEFLVLNCYNHRSLIINCPRLAHLSTLGQELDLTMRLSEDTLAPSLYCPGLNTLSLARVHTAAGVIRSMAAHAPKVEKIEVFQTTGSLFQDLAYFKVLQVLMVASCGTIRGHDFSEWPLLRSLTLRGQDFAQDLMVHHQGLISLFVDNELGTNRFSIMCPKLKELTLWGEGASMACLENINSSCPRLKRLDLHGSWDYNLPVRPLRLYHLKVEEFRVEGVFEHPMDITCPNLKKMVMAWEDGNPALPTSLNTYCPSPSCLQLFKCPDLSCLPLIVSALPSLRSLEIVHSDGWKVELRHSSIEYVIIDHVALQGLALNMPNLKRVGIVDSSVLQVLHVTSTEVVLLECTRAVLVGSGVNMKQFIPVGEMVEISLAKWWGTC